MSNLSKHEQSLLDILSTDEWKSQRELRTSRQSLNKLKKLKLIKERFTKIPAYHAPEIGREYRLIGTP